eukprot:CAMPEP_0175999616 /NCGR_PEP_ID=MMETSP0108-20121206/57381_1 /TAXON_ID=195067 ORGANISM="Goniomonas pacifica, Strain CCMP1869" /NCGR_SAMPLE_ID=MMETSP0108 /ASSEMBLY_ACC=CAM_ASM_000204 /LENGTH=120 /DNA_ID=CAMNT_0017332059 /DNA_START=186 /DNA_END=548 /DNA_ORIENTATION=+
MSDAADDSGRCHEGKWAVSGDASVSTSKDGPRSGTLVLLFDDDDDDDRLAEAISCLSRFGHPWRRDRDLRALGVPVDNVESSVSTSKLQATLLTSVLHHVGEHGMAVDGVPHRGRGRASG